MTLRNLAALALAAGCASASLGDTLWDQSARNWYASGFPNQLGGQYNTHFTVCDVTVGGAGWTVDSITMYYTDWGLPEWPGSMTGRVNVFAKTGSLPTNSPTSGGLVPALMPMTVAWSLDPVPGTIAQAMKTVTVSGLNLHLTPGQYWIGIAPAASSAENGLASATQIGDASPYYGTYHGLPQDPPANTWLNVHAPTLLDAAILVTGTPDPLPCRADIVGLGGSPTPDHLVTVDDLVYYLSQFFAGNAAVADIVGLGGSPTPDTLVTVDDLVAYLSLFFAGCP